MQNNFRDALSQVKAEDQLRQDTIDYLRKQIYRKKRATPLHRIAVAAAALAIVAIAGLYAFNLYFTQSAIIDIDVNPAIELKLNRFDRVIGVYAYNEDGQTVLEQLELDNMTWQEAISNLINKFVELGYVGDDGIFSATLLASDEQSASEKLAALQDYVAMVLDNSGKSLSKDVFAVSQQTKDLAHHENLTPAKYLAILELQALDPSATFDNCRDHSISEIVGQTHQHREGAASAGAAGNNSGAGENTATNHESGNGASGNGTGASAAAGNNESLEHAQGSQSDELQNHSSDNASTTGSGTGSGAGAGAGGTGAGAGAAAGGNASGGTSEHQEGNSDSRHSSSHDESE